MSARVFRDEIISPGLARLVLACVPLGIFSAFLWPGGANIAAVILAATGVVVLLRAPGLAALPPLVLAGLWIVFLLLMTIYASAWGAPGRPFRGLDKHLPLALGPPAAIALSAACQRLRFGLNDLVALFLAGLVAGALAMLVRAGALGMFAHGWPQFSEDALGTLNRNYAALACGVSLIAIAALIARLSGAGHMRMAWRAGAIAALALVFLGECALLAAFQSRMGYVATAVGLAVWCGLMMVSVLRGAGGGWGLAIPAAVVLAAVAGVAHYFPLIGNRLGAAGATATYMREISELMRGNAIDSSALLAAGGERLQLIALALDLIRQRPWLGWGPDASQLIALFSPYPGIRELNQFHNGYLQVLVSFGIVGGILNAALLASLLWSAFRRRRPASPDRLAPPLFAAAIALMAYILATSVTESIIFVKPVGIICMFLAALACMKDRATTTGVIGSR
jgi:O-antigen ligase